MTVVFRTLYLGVMVFAIAGCGTSRLKEKEKLAILYNESAQYEGIDRNPVIVIPGILGSRLVDDPSDKTLWGAFVYGAADPQKPEDARLIALPVADTDDLSSLKDDGRPDGVLETVQVQLLGIPLSLQAYAQIIGTLGAGGYRDQQLGLAGAIDYGSDHYTCFQFDYDWRLDNAENAARLKAFIEEKRAFVQAERERRFGITDADVKFDLVAHSMGGLVTRYMLRYGDQPLKPGTPPDLNWAGAAHVERVFLVGTPNHGSSEALTQLINGKDLGLPLLPFYQPAVLGSFPSIYQLLPRPQHGALVQAETSVPVNFYDPAVWHRYGWGLSDPNEDQTLSYLLPQVATPAERRRIAQGLQAAMLAQARAFHTALDIPAEAPEGLEIYLIAGDGVDTIATLAVDEDTGGLTPIQTAPGDGTVLRTSVLADERVAQDWINPRLQTPIDYHQVLLLPDDHLGLTRSGVFQDNLLFWLLEDDRTHSLRNAYRAGGGH